MTDKSKIRILNGTLGLTALVLGVSLLMLWQRGDSESFYLAMADTRSAPPSVQGTPVSDPAAGQLQVAYTYQENRSTEWLAINPHYMGWVRIPGTKVDYPFVRSQDNQDYLYRDIRNRPSDAGTIFMDYRNLGNFNDRHSILYGHNMKGGAMFHNLRFYKDKRFLEAHPVIELSGLYETRRYRIFSVYEVSADDYALPVDFSDQAFAAYLTTLQEKSLHGGSEPLNPQARLLTLTTCSYGVDNGRFIVHGLELPPEPETL